MKKTYRNLLILTLLFSFVAPKAMTQPTFSSFERAKLHPISANHPAPDFFAGALLGNGGMGVVVTTRPDAVVLYFGHNNVWDIRIAENNRDKIGTFNEVFSKVKAIPDTLKLLTNDPWYREYSLMTGENYRKPYPRPFPCGSVLLGFDRRNAELTGHRLDISEGMCEVFLLTKDKRELKLQLFADMTGDRLWMQLVDKQGNPCRNVFDRIRVMTDPSTPREFPKANTLESLPEGMLSFRQVLPYQEPDKYDQAKGHPKDKAFRLTAFVNGPLVKTTRIDWDGNTREMSHLEAGIGKKDDFVACVSLEEGLNSVAATGKPRLPGALSEMRKESQQKSTAIWKEYWNKSGVSLSDEFLEKIWYHNLYFLNCAAKEEATTPGLFANWSYNTIGTAWHGDYHMNYNTQQPFWASFSTNHLEKSLPYVKLIEFLMNVSTNWARDYYQLPGAYFPHSAYPVDMTMSPYPVPTWGWEICETPWAVQGLWWHYLYSGDTGFLRSRAFGPLKAAVEFLVAYMKRPESRGPQWKDNNFHIFPTVPPELYGLRPGFKYNYDCNADLSLTRFTFNAFIQAAGILGMETQEKELIADVKNILAHFPEYPTAVSKEYGKILVSAPEEHDQVVYNAPLALFTVFPGEDHGLHSDKATMEILKNTFRNQQNEGGNDLVFLNLQAARIGMLDLEKFKRQVDYCLLPNGTATLMVLQVHGRYGDTTPYDFMGRMGMWFENFALPAVVDECLMQSYDGTIRLFTNWPAGKDAEFRQLRAAGGFLVSASLKGGKVTGVEIVSEAGGILKIMLPWETGGTIKTADGVRQVRSGILELKTRKDETISLKP